MVRRLALDQKIVAEASGALAVVAALEESPSERGRSVAIVTGSSIDAAKLAVILADENAAKTSFEPSGPAFRLTGQNQEDFMKLSTWLSVALAATLTTLSTDASAKLREDFERVVPFSAGGSFEIRNSNGSIHVKTWDEDTVRIEAEKEAKSEDHLADIEIVIEGSGDSVSVETVHHQRKQPREGQLRHFDTGRGQRRRHHRERNRYHQRHSRPCRRALDERKCQSGRHRR